MEMAKKTSYYKETWDILEVMKAVAPGPMLVEYSSTDILDLAGVTDEHKTRHWFIYDLRQRGLIETDAPLDSRRKVRGVKLTPMGHRVVDTYHTKGEEAASRMLPSKPNRSKPTQPNKKPMTRAEAIVEARDTLGAEAPVDDLIKMATFILGES